jgi:thioredoxin 1
MVIAIKDQDFDQQVLKSSLPVVVDFWAPRCGPCGKISALLEKLSVEHNDKLKFCKINVDENHDTASKYHVMSIPTLLFLRNGQVMWQSVGLVREADLRSNVGDLLQSPA